MMKVVKLNYRNQEVLRYPAEPLSISVPNGIGVCAYFALDDVVTAYTTFAKGDRLHEYFFTDRWYNVFALYAGDSDQLKGWYCNVCRPSIITASEIRCADLELDVWIAADGDVLVLDRDELDAIRGELEVGEYEMALAAVAEIQELAAAGKLMV